METLKVKLIAYKNAPKEIFEEGKAEISKYLKEYDVEFSKTEVDVLFVLSGGSELQAKEIIDAQKELLVIAKSGNNSYAAATEIKAYGDSIGKSILLADIDNQELSSLLRAYLKVKTANAKLSSCKIGVLGNVSDWLIASSIDEKLLYEKLGVSLQRLDWRDYQSYENYAESPEFNALFDNFDKNELSAASKVYSMLNQINQIEKLDAITVECFPMVKEQGVTACLALSKLNADGFPAGCEGDIVSITGMTIIKYLLGQIPWMANLIEIKDNSVLFAHCTVALNKVSNFEIDTHYETNKGCAIGGEIESKEITVLRLNNKLSQAFIAEGEVIAKPKRKNACRTQIEVSLQKESIKMLREKPLGNHHLVVDGHHKQLLGFFCKWKQINLISKNI